MTEFAVGSIVVKVVTFFVRALCSDSRNVGSIVFTVKWVPLHSR